MFHHIEGKLSELGPSYVVIDCGGIGFLLNTSLNTLSCLTVGQVCRLFVSEAVTEDAFDLYGFYTKSERRCFEMLISVSGIGPKAALSILSANTPEGLTLAVLNNDEKALTVAPGIGKKIAQRVILELKDKIGKGSEDLGFTQPVRPAQAGESGAVGDAVAALAVLGYSSSEVGAILKTMDTDALSTEQIIKAVLKHMVK